MKNLLATIKNPKDYDELLSKVKPHRKQMRPIAETAHLFNCDASQILGLYKELNEIQKKNPTRYAAL